MSTVRKFKTQYLHLHESSVRSFKSKLPNEIPIEKRKPTEKIPKHYSQTDTKMGILEGPREEIENELLHKIVPLVQEFHMPKLLIVNLDQTPLKHVLLKNGNTAEKGSTYLTVVVFRKWLFVKITVLYFFNCFLVKIFETYVWNCFSKLCSYYMQLYQKLNSFTDIFKTL